MKLARSIVRFVTRLDAVWMGVALCIVALGLFVWLAGTAEGQ